MCPQFQIGNRKYKAYRYEPVSTITRMINQCSYIERLVASHRTSRPLRGNLGQLLASRLLGKRQLGQFKKNALTRRAFEKYVASCCQLASLKG